MRPVSRILVSAYYSALVAALPELLRMRPDLRSTGDGPEGHSQQIRATELYAELAELREIVLSSGAFLRRNQRRQLARDVAAADAHDAATAGCTTTGSTTSKAITTTSTNQCSVDPMAGIELDQEKIFHDTERGDLLIIRGDERLLIDVTIVRRRVLTHLRNPRLNVLQRGLACAAAAECAKHAKYNTLCKERGWTMIPFAIEAHGAVGESARQLLHKLASKVDDTSGQAFLHDAYARLSVALQSANAAIAIGGLQRLRVNQLSADPDVSGTRSERVRLTTTHCSSHG
jgi:hypothetical protein